ncbi:hypothetical protein KO500_11645 [Cellulophaga baltica]|nr:MULTISPECIES: hypothetical protein [Cellulophaga]MBU2997092.1 hypothetical protein [Cellulophaga baltica]MDO6768490.1 hypothetical protein [Cellulophaga sp. 1_MG-2023]
MKKQRVLTVSLIVLVLTIFSACREQHNKDNNKNGDKHKGRAVVQTVKN